MALIIPAKADGERDAVARAWEERGGDVVRLDRFWEVPADIDRSQAKLYGNDTFCLVVAQKLGVTLLAPEDRLLASAPGDLLKRQVRLQRLADIKPAVFPTFAKPAIPKQFASGVYVSLDALLDECKGLPGDAEVLLSEVVSFQAEARAFVLDGVVRACSVYEGEGNVDHAAKLAERVIMALELPRTCVVDVGHLGGDAWALIELNATWGAGLNGCEPVKVLDCIAAATVA